MQRFSVCERCAVVEPPAGPKFKVCGQCRAVRYCSRECQARDWTASHEKKCGRRFEDATLLGHWVRGIMNAAAAAAAADKPEPNVEQMLSLLSKHLSDTKWDVHKALAKTAHELMCPCLVARYANLANPILEHASGKPLQCCNATCAFRSLSRPLLCASKADVPCGLSRNGHVHIIARWFCCSQCEARGMAAQFLET